MKKFDINGTIVEFDTKMNNYNSVRKLFINQALELSKEFKEYCDENVNSLKDLTVVAHELGEKYIEDAIVKGVETIVSYKIITIDIPTFKENYCKKYQNYQRLLNNLIRNTSSNKSKKNNYLTTNSIKPLVEEISNYIYRDYFNIHFAVVDALIENNIEEITMPLNEENIKISNALFNNYRDGFISSIDESNVVNQIITLNPYRVDIYEFLIKEDGDFNKEIEKLADFIGYDIKPYKDQLMEKYIENCLAVDKYNPELIKDKVIKYGKYIGISNEELYLTRVDAIFMFANA